MNTPINRPPIPPTAIPDFVEQSELNRTKASMIKRAANMKIATTFQSLYTGMGAAM
jgi:hypothetical protein